jgi:hypothetical protein
MFFHVGVKGVYVNGPLRAKPASVSVNRPVPIRQYSVYVHIKEAGLCVKLKKTTTSCANATKFYLTP